ncbi:MAG: N-acetyltransferase [Myxococcota bacterium]
METSVEPKTPAEEAVSAPALDLEKPSEEHPFGAPPKDLPALEPASPTRIIDTAGVRIERVDLGNKGDRKRFLDMVAPLYAGDPNYIEPLRMERMQFLDTKNNIALKDIEMYAMIAHQNGKPVGRMTAHIDHAYDRYHQSKSGWFGFFECINDRKVAHAMLAEGSRWLKQKGAVDMIGPMNFNTNHQCGLLVENFNRPAVVEMTYNPQYYQELITSFGLAKAKDLYAWWIDVDAGINNPKVARINKLAERVKQRNGVVIRNVSIKDFDREVKTMFDLYNKAWQKNWGFVPVSEDEFVHIAKNLKPIAREELLLVVEVKGEPVGFCVTLPDVNEVVPRDGKLFPFGWAKLLFGLKKIKHARLMVLGMAPDYRKRGLESLMFIETAVRAKQIGMSSGEIGWTLEDNWLVNRAIESMDGRLDRRYRLFGATL